MDPETLKALADLPVVIVLVFLLYRQQQINEALLIRFAQSERDHATNLVTILTHGTFCKQAIPQDVIEKV
jgi:hypothetical protein